MVVVGLLALVLPGDALVDDWCHCLEIVEIHISVSISKWIMAERANFLARHISNLVSFSLSVSRDGLGLLLEKMDDSSFAS